MLKPTYGQFKEGATLKKIIKNLNHLEGVAEGLAIFHPRVGRYILENVNEIWRVLHNNILPDSLENPDKKSKPGFEQIDKEALDDPGIMLGPSNIKQRIEDRKIMDGVL